MQRIGFRKKLLTWTLARPGLVGPARFASENKHYRKSKSGRLTGATRRVPDAGDQAAKQALKLRLYRGRKSAGVGNCQSLLILGLRPY